MTSVTVETTDWVDVAPLEVLTVGRGVAALVGDEQVALFCVGGGRVYAIANRDPWSGANVMSRGIVGTLGDRLVVASPMYKHHIDLATGQAVEHPEVRVATYQARVAAGRVEVRWAPTTADESA